MATIARERKNVMNPWIPPETRLPERGQRIDWLAPDGELVERGMYDGVWLLPNSGMYIYYTPIFWRLAIKDEQ
jgi:hypothetical protein